jgi:glycosyltransferase involved in cell wall biosynthesis
MKIAMVFPTRESEKAISGYSVTLTETMRKKGIDIDDITYTAGKPFSLFKQLSNLSKYDVVHIQHEYNLLGWYGLPFFIVLIYLSLFKLKLILTMHTALSQKEKFKERKIKTILRKILYFTQNRVINWTSNGVVVHANFFKEILVNEYGFKGEKIVIFPQGIIEGIKTLSKNEARKKFHLSGPVYLFMGSMIPDHGHDIIIKKAKQIGATILVVANHLSVNDRNTNRNLSYLEENKRYVQENKLVKFVRFDVFDITDKNPEWWEYFSAADLVLLPYRGGIGSGIFAHAMAMKKPVIASNILFFKEISKNFGCIKIAKTESEYPKLIKESIKPKNYSKMVNECNHYIKEYGLSVLALKYKHLYSSL